MYEENWTIGTDPACHVAPQCHLRIEADRLCYAILAEGIRTPSWWCVESPVIHEMGGLRREHGLYLEPRNRDLHSVDWRLVYRLAIMWTLTWPSMNPSRAEPQMGLETQGEPRRQAELGLLLHHLNRWNLVPEMESAEASRMQG